MSTKNLLRCACRVPKIYAVILPAILPVNIKAPYSDEEREVLSEF
jgi:hypothetical protein